MFLVLYAVADLFGMFGVSEAVARLLKVFEAHEQPPLCLGCCPSYSTLSTLNGRRKTPMLIKSFILCGASVFVLLISVERRFKSLLIVIYLYPETYLILKSNSQI